MATLISFTREAYSFSPTDQFFRYGLSLILLDELRYLTTYWRAKM